MPRKGDLALDRPKDIEQHVLEYYTSLFASENSCSSNDLVDSVISPAFSDDDNLLLANPPSKNKYLLCKVFFFYHFII